MFWKVPGFSQYSAIDSILYRDEYMLEDLLDEDDMIQECKSLNNRLVAFLKERSSVEQLLRYLIEEPDSDDPKRTYKYPFTACEVLCCDIEAVYNTMLEDSALMTLLFSLLDAPAPLNSKTAGYFARVAVNLLARKGQEVKEFMQLQGTVLLEKLVKHIDTASIAEVIKRLVGAEDQSSILLSSLSLSGMSEWLAETPLVDLLLERLGDKSSEAQSNAADILCATAHTQPSPLAARLAAGPSISSLVSHALAPGRRVLAPCLDVCIALVEPRGRVAVMMANGGNFESIMGLMESQIPSQEAMQQAKDSASMSIVEHLSRFVEVLSLDSGGDESQETSYGLLTPPLGRHRLKVAELLAVLARSGCDVAETAVIDCQAIPQCLHLFATFPFNNILHHSVSSMLISCISSSSEVMLSHVFEQCHLLDWIVGLPRNITPTPKLGDATAPFKAPLRAGYLGHITHVSGVIENLATAPRGRDVSEEGSVKENSPAGSTSMQFKISSYTGSSEAWIEFVSGELYDRQEIENTSMWQCGRPTPRSALVGLNTNEVEEFQQELNLEALAGMQQPLYHRYTTEENEEEEDEEEEDYRAPAYEYNEVHKVVPLVGDGYFEAPGGGGRRWWRKEVVEEGRGYEDHEEVERGAGGSHDLLDVEDEDEVLMGDLTSPTKVSPSWTDH